jgi:hypothetical protein
VLAAIRLFAGCAGELLHQVEPIAADPRALLNATARLPVAHVVYPAACGRIAEILGLLGLLAATVDDADPLRAVLPDTGAVEQTVAALVAGQRGTAHPIGDSFAVGLIPPALLVARRDPDAARRFVTRAAVWVADRYDDSADGIGLAPAGADPAAEIAQLLGGPYDSGPRRRSSSYLATILTDLAAVLPGGATLYADVVNEFLAIDAIPQLAAADEQRAQWRPDGPGVRLVVRVEYRDPLPAGDDAAAHFRDAAAPIPAWDAVALASVVRNRHSIPATRTLLRDDAS